MGIRRGEMSDLNRLTEIYNEAIESEVCTCDMEVFTMKDRRKWLEEHLNNIFPIWVYEINGEVVGYIYLSPYRLGRKALDTVCEVSYYIDFKHHGNGIGSELLEYALDEAKKLAYTDVIAILLSCNNASIKLLNKFNFSIWGEMPSIARINEMSYSHLYFGKKI